MEANAAVLAPGTAAEALAVIAPCIGGALVSPAALDRLLAAAAAAPLSMGGGVECHLANADRADFSVRYLADELAAVATPWAAGLARLWPDGGRGLRITWLEVDVQPGFALPPSVFAGAGYPPDGPPPGAPDPAEWAAILRVLWPDAPPGAFAQLERLQRVLPDGCWLGYLGFMRGRELRVTLSGMLPDAAPGLLGAAGWPGDTALLAPALAMAARYGGRLTLGLDVTQGCGDRLGVEVAPPAAEGWAALVDAAAALAPVTADAVAALAAWPGVTVAQADWPAALRRRAGAMLRRVNHLKFSFAGAAPPALKAYLYYGLASGL